MQNKGIYWALKRGVDVGLIVTTLPIVIPLAVVTAVAVKLTSRGPAIYWSDRVGANGRLFSMPKFRTMRVGTPAVATHLLADAQSVLTPIGGVLRRSSLDELPQLWSVLIGDMTLVGPRPALYNQKDLIALRQAEGVDRLIPGMTGLAQIWGRDQIPTAQKVAYDREYLERCSLGLDFRILFVTFLRVARREGIQH